MTVKRDATFLDLFIEVTKAITASLDLDEVFNLITRKIPEIIGVDAATIRLLDAAGAARAIAQVGQSGVEAIAGVVRRGGSGAAGVLPLGLRRQPVVAARAGAEPLAVHLGGVLGHANGGITVVAHTKSHVGVGIGDRRRLISHAQADRDSGRRTVSELSSILDSPS